MPTKFGDQRNALKQNQFGVAIGGPVVFPKLYNGRNKTFFFGGYEGYRQDVASQSTGLAPTAAQLSGNFQGFNTIYNPTTGHPFPNNTIPTSQINPIAAAYAKVNYPTGPYVASGNNYIDNSPFQPPARHLLSSRGPNLRRTRQPLCPRLSVLGTSNFIRRICRRDEFRPRLRLERRDSRNSYLRSHRRHGRVFRRNLGDADTGNNPLRSDHRPWYKFAFVGRQSQFPRQFPRLHQPCSRPVWVLPI